MSMWLVIFVGVIYAVIAADHAFRGNWPMCIVFLGYALANAGLCLVK